MHPQLNQIIARERVADMHRVAERERLAAAVTAAGGSRRVGPHRRASALLARLTSRRASSPATTC